MISNLKIVCRDAKILKTCSGYLIEYEETVFQVYINFSIISNLFIIFRDLTGYSEVGVAWVNSMCTYRSISIVDIGRSNHFNPNSLAQVIVHELGHGLGLTHTDGDSNCSCSTVKREYCIMHSTIQNNW
ncbi:hypothetical protein HZS_4781 [Henneguya salminicola]|nr:hypothetical protein HZS_4781 [Henneguya salminicola]